MASRTYHRDKRGRFHGASGASSSDVGRAGGFAAGNKMGGRGATRVKGGVLRRGARLAGKVARNPLVRRQAVRGAIAAGGVVLAGNLAAGVPQDSVRRALAPGTGIGSSGLRRDLQKRAVGARNRNRDANRARIKYRTEW